MMQILPRLARLLTFAAVALLLVRPTFADDIPTLASKDPQFSTLVKLLQAADLVDALKGKGPFTVLAPTNDAFAKIPADKVAELLKPENKAMLKKILLYHVIAGKITTAELAGATVGMKGPTMSGDELTVTSLDPPMVNNAKIIKTDIMADNGVIHVIDTVLMPGQDTAATSAASSTSSMSSGGAMMPTPGLQNTVLGTSSITEIAAGDPQFSTLVKLVKAAGFDTTLANRGPLTVFAPTNAAFDKLPAGTVDMLLMPRNIALLQSILEYHFVGGQYVAADVATLNGQNVPTTLRGATLAVSTSGGAKVNNANIVKADVGAKKRCHPCD